MHDALDRVDIPVWLHLNLRIRREPLEGGRRLGVCFDPELLRVVVIEQVPRGSAEQAEVVGGVAVLGTARRVANAVCFQCPNDQIRRRRAESFLLRM